MHDKPSAPVQELLENLERQAGRPGSSVYHRTDADMDMTSFRGMSQGTVTPHSVQSSGSGADGALQSPSSSGTGALSIGSYRRVYEGYLSWHNSHKKV